jgi:hypothetical protein
MNWGRRPVKDMSCKYNSILEKGLRFEYEYDFGSATALVIGIFDYMLDMALKEIFVLGLQEHSIEKALKD